ncbi:MlaA family lipoprotein [Indioceanicola profundi]|uniref:MlaA family lipoprotein n=1 Tax=Indioceanicola profundi TaxID=2220096 RepID=UPI001CED5AB1|nr:VacJ family lipoprotein [Indioceanicola profundi]
MIRSPHRRRSTAACALALLIGLGSAGPALAQDNVNDPLEPVNRAVFWFNEALDVVLIRPAAEIYRAVVPDPAQRGVRNVLQNLRSPLDLTNQLLQGDWKGAGTVTKRFLINTTVGIGGIFDVAGQNGLTYEYESFDQTLAVWGVPEGPYLVLPLIGSSSLRDAAGFGVEFLADPVSNYAANTDQDWITYTRAGLTVVDTRAGYIEAIDDLKRNSFDYYAAMRSLYRQRRDGWIRDGAPAQDAFPDIPDYDEE